MEYKELTTKSASELHKLLGEMREELRTLNFKSSERQLGQVRRVRVLKRDIARVLTAINAKTKAAA